MLLYFVRHGKTQWNAEGRFQGAKKDLPLLKESYDSIHKLGESLSSVCFDYIYSSDLIRAKQTAEIINDCNQKPQAIICTKELREWDLGKLEGQKISIIEAIYPKQMEVFKHNFTSFKTNNFNAESVYQAIQRLKRFLLSIPTDNVENVLIVGHGAQLTASIRDLLGYKEPSLRVRAGLENASLTILRTDDFKHYKLVLWNDTSHYEQSIKEAQ